MMRSTDQSYSLFGDVPKREIIIDMTNDGYEVSVYVFVFSFSFFTLFYPLTLAVRPLFNKVAFSRV